VPRGVHPDPPRGLGPAAWAWHTDPGACAEAMPHAGVPVAPAALAATTALRLGDHRIALGAVHAAVGADLCTPEEVDDAIAALDWRHQGRDRAVSAWEALRGAAPEAAARPRPGAGSP